MKRLAFVAALILSASAAAQYVMPTDPRIQTLLYDRGRIYPIEVTAGYTLLIGFAGGEHVETMAVGDNSAWQVTANKRGDSIFVKRNYSGINTNLTVITDARTYVFELIGNSNPKSNAPLVIRFTYPEPARLIPMIKTATPTVAYRVEGVRSLRPSQIEVRVNSVALAWPAGVPVPAVFEINEDGTESLINGTFLDDRMIIQGVPQRLMFRSGRQLATATRYIPKQPRR